MLRLKLATPIILALVTAVHAQTIQINRDNKTIAISSTDEASAVADIAAISIGYEIFGPDAATAQTNAGQLSHAIMDALHKAGVEDKDIESKNQSLYRNAQFGEKESEAQRAQRQFVFQQSWEVVASPKDAAMVIKLAQDAGANQSGNIEWRLTDRKTLQAQAGANALVKAHAIASQMADGLHVKFGQLIYASNEVPEARISFAKPKLLNGYGAGVGGGMGGGGYITLPLEIHPQAIKEQATVYAVFSIE
jgi:uncharacterized protein YggE